MIAAAMVATPAAIPTMAATPTTAATMVANTAAPTISVTAISKTGTIYGGEQFDLTYTVADADTATSNLIVSAIADSSAVSVSVDTASKRCWSLPLLSPRTLR